MATLEMVHLRSTMPYSGRVTLRHSVPIIMPAGAVDLRVDGSGTETSTTPQVDARPQTADGETPARKGGEAR
jgi:hypothetical protein